MGSPLDCENHCSVSFCRCTQASNQINLTNQMRTGPLVKFSKMLDNIQGGVEILDLKTGPPIAQHSVKKIPITEEVTLCIEQLFKRDAFNLMENLFLEHVLCSQEWMQDNDKSTLATMDEEDSVPDILYDGEETDGDDKFESDEEKPIPGMQKNQCIGSQDPHADGDPVLQPLSRSTRVHVRGTTLEPIFHN